MGFIGTPAFTKLVPVHPYGTDPSAHNLSVGQPAPVRQTSRSAWVSSDLGTGKAQNATIDSSFTPAFAQITCTLANVEAGRHLIRLRGYELRPHLDFAVGVSDGDLATNLANAIRRIPGFTATALLNVVTVQTVSGHGDWVPFSVLELSAASAFSVGTLDVEGYMNRGGHGPGAPTLG